MSSCSDVNTGGPAGPCAVMAPSSSKGSDHWPAPFHKGVTASHPPLKRSSIHQESCHHSRGCVRCSSLEVQQPCRRLVGRSLAVHMPADAMPCLRLHRRIFSRAHVHRRDQDRELRAPAAGHPPALWRLRDQVQQPTEQNAVAGADAEDKAKQQK